MGGMSGFTMIQSNKYNRSLTLDRKRMSQNPYALKGAEKQRNPKEYKEMIQHRFARKNQSAMVSKIVFGFIALMFLISILFMLLF
jgi:hypothetical protein